MTSLQSPAAEQEQGQQQLLAVTLATIRGFSDLIDAHAQYLDEDGRRVVIPALERALVHLVAGIAVGRSRPLNAAIHGA